MSETRYPLEFAKQVAARYRAALKDFCEPDRVVIAGSIRRRKETVKDIEIVYIPKMIDGPSADLFTSSKASAVDRMLEAFMEHGLIKKRLNKNGHETWGESNKLALDVSTGMPVDLFATNEESWYNYLVCRTGGAENNKAIAMAAQKKGWKWNPYSVGFSKQEGLSVTIEIVRSEYDVFKFVGMKYLDPWQRT